jgi:lipopolysaccharide heptosyltransferase II
VAESRPSRRRYELQLWIDRRVGPLLCAILLGVKRLSRRPRTAPSPDAVRRILLVKFWGMGSIVLASALIGRLRAMYPEARVDFVSLRENEPLLGLVPGLGRTLGIDLSRGNLRFLRDSVRTLIGLRRERYDLLLDLEFFTRFSAIFSYLAGARRSHGFSAKGSWRGRLHDVEVPFNAYNHVASNFETLVRGDPIRPAPASAADAGLLPGLATPEAAWQACRDLLVRDPAWRDGRPLVAVNPNAGDMAIERRWPIERSAELLQRLCEDRDVNVVLVGASKERAFVESVAHASGAVERVVNLAGRIDVPQLVALLARAELLVTSDSGPMHIAAAVGTSTVALFGPETPTLYAPLRSRADQEHRVHYLGLACSPCMFVHDDKVLSCWFAQARCMTGIESRDVLASVDALLARSGSEHGPPRLRVID